MDGQEPTTPSPQAGDPTGSTSPEPTTPQAGAPANDDKSQRELAEARSDAAKYRKSLRDTETRLKQLEEANLSEVEKAKKEMDELRGYKSSTSDAVKTLQLQMSVERQARRLGIVDEEAAFALMDKSAITFGENGKPDDTTVKAAIDALLTARPWLKPAQAAPPPAPALNPANPGKPAAAGSLTLADVNKMSQAEINARWDEVQNVLKAGR